jgi:hypothetical protein
MGGGEESKCRKLTGEEEYGMNLSEWVGEGTEDRDDLGGEADRRAGRIGRCFGDGVLVPGEEVGTWGTRGYGVGLKRAKS